MAVPTRTSPDYLFAPPPVGAGVEAAPPADSVDRRIRLAALVALAAGAFGLLARDVIETLQLTRPHPASVNIYFRLYALHESSFLWLTVLAGALTWIVVSRPAMRAVPPWTTALIARGARVPIWLCALSVTVVAAVGSVVVMHGIGLSMDEFAATFQARIFASGRLEAPVPADWRGLAPWMTPVFINYKPDAGTWVAAYLPVYAAMRAAFSLVSAEWLVNPMLAGATVMLVPAVARRLWTGERAARAGGLSLLFLLLSTQFVVTSMSGYSMPAHLCLNLLWLWLYLRGDRWSLAVLPWVGVLALGLHNPVPHALFASPFLVRLLRDRRFGFAAYCAPVYFVGVVAWYAWLTFVHKGVPSGTGADAAATAGSVALGFLTNFSLPGIFDWFVQGMNVSLFFAWQTPILAILVPLAALSWKRLGPVERDLAIGVLVAWSFYALFNANQGHGWGYRYLYPVLGNAALLAGRSATDLWESEREGLVARLVLASAVITLAVQLPLRAVQTERFVRPYAAALEFIASRPAAVVALDPASAWYGRDLVRNDPFLATAPKVVSVGPISGYRPGLMLVPASARDSVHLLTPRELAELGLPVFQQTRR